MTDFARLVLDADTRGLKAGERDLDNFARTSNKTAGTVSTGMIKIGAAIGSVVALAGGIGSIVRVNAEFGKSMSQVAAVSGATAGELEDLRATALRMGADTAFSAAQAADALGFLAQAGFTAAEAIEAIPDVLSLAAAGGLELAQAADIAANVIAGFTLTTADAARVSDVLAKSAAATNSSVADMGQAMSTAAPIAAALGISIEETAAAIGVMSDAGIKGERAGTALRGIFASLAGPTTQAQEALAKYGITAAEIDPQVVGLSAAMQTIADRGVSTADAFVIFGREAASGALVMAETSARMKTLTSDFQNAEGAAAQMAMVMRDNLTGDIDGLTGSVETLIIKLGDAGATGTLRTLAQTGTAAINMVADNMDGLVSVVTVAGSAYAAYRIAAIAGTLATTAFSGSLGIYSAAVISTARNVGVLSAAQVAMTGATAGARTAMAGLVAGINPLGAVLAVATAGLGYYAVASARVAAENDRINSTLDELEGNLRAAGIEVNGTGRAADIAAPKIFGVGNAYAFAAKQARQLANDARLAQLAQLNADRQTTQRQMAAQQGGTSATDPRFQALRAAGRFLGFGGDDSQLEKLRAQERRLTANINALVNAPPQAINATATAANVASAAVGGIGKAMETNAAQAKAAADSIKIDIDGIMAGLFPLEAELARVTKNMSDLEKVRGQVGDAAYVRAREALSKQADALRSEIDYGAILPADMIPQFKDWETALGGFQKKAETTSVRVAETFRDMAERTVQSFSNLANSIRGGGFLDILQSVIGLGLQLGSIGAFGKGIQTSLNAPAHANGTDYAPGGLSLVGERGPEWVNLPRGSKVWANGTMPGGSTRVDVVPSPYFNAVVDGRIVNAAPALANAGAVQAQTTQAQSGRRRVPR